MVPLRFHLHLHGLMPVSMQIALSSDSYLRAAVVGKSGYEQGLFGMASLAPSQFLFIPFKRSYDAIQTKNDCNSAACLDVSQNDLCVHMQADV